MDGAIPGHGIRLRPALRAAGWSDAEIWRARRRGDLRPVRRGAYLDAADPALCDAVLRHRARIGAVVAQLGPGAVVSHVSAAVLYGLPVWGLPLDRVHVTRDRTHGGRRTRDLHVHPSPLPVEDRTVVADLPVTTPGRTVVDVARAAGFHAGVVLADRALAPPSRDRPPLLAPDEFAGAVARLGIRSGSGTVRRVAAFADGRSGSVGESRMRITLAEAGFPAPDLQWPVVTAGRRYLVDFAWPRQRLVAEFDGRVKYGRTLRPGQSLAEVLWDEKRREDRIRRENYAVHRWVWDDVEDFADAAARLREALGR